jgi:drug/metabolite transporter (DMT)-like permease
LSPVTTALLLAVASTAMFATMHALARHASSALHPFEVAFFRSLFGLLAVLPLAARVGWHAFRSNRPGTLILRGVMGGASLLAWFFGLSVVPLAAATAISFSSAIFASIGAVLFLGERMGTRRSSAAVIGFVGTVLILRPGTAPSSGALIVLLSAVLWGMNTVILKNLSRRDSTVTIVVWTGVSLCLVTVIPALLVWRPPSAVEYLWMALIGMFGTLGSLAWTQALKMVDATLVIPVDFTRLVWASGLGFVLFAEVPDGWTWAGSALIIGSTGYIGWREARLARNACRQAMATREEPALPAAELAGAGLGAGTESP